VQALDLARRWLSDCVNGERHAVCQQKTGTNMPTRLIEIIGTPRNGEEEEENWSVRLTHPQKSEPYVALSYCWGGDQPLKAARDTEKAWLQGIDRRLLPQTLRDAVIVSSALGVSLIWIDSLCILQDDDNDKAREISKMPQIYSNVFLTISAA
jgi:hypothetical protein